jgi:hypothetical protein
MNANDVKEIVSALAPAGQAVHHTASIYLIKELVAELVPLATITGSIMLIGRTILKVKDRDDVNKIIEENERMVKANARAMEGGGMNYADAERFAKAYERYKLRHTTKVISKMDGKYYHYQTKTEAVDALIKFMEEN